MQRLTSLIATVAAMAALATALPAGAQQRERAEVRVPRGYEPPRGMCRIWLEGVPAGQQPAPTDCATAIRKRPSNASVVFGEPVRGTGDRTPPVVRPLAPERERPPTRRGEAEERPRPETQRREPPREEAPAERGDSERRRVEPASETRGRARPSRPPDADHEEYLSSAEWLDEELLAALYDPGRHEAAGNGRRSDGGRATPRAGERGRSAIGAGTLEWARGVDGRALSALEVERWLRYDAGPTVLVDAGSLPDRGLVRARPGECYDRDFDGRCDDLAAGADGCWDLNRDGRCDDLRRDYPGERGVRPGDAYGRSRPRGAGYDARYGDGNGGGAQGLCFDRDRDGRCDEPWSDGRRIPQTLPAMAAAAGLRRGQASYDVERWLRRSDVSARVTDRDQDGVPERVLWLDPRGQIVQVWTDRDGDGIADRVELFRDGMPVQVIER